VTLILDHWIPARDRARMETILAWLAGLPAATVTGDPRLALVKATNLQEIGRTDEADRWPAVRTSAAARRHPLIGHWPAPRRTRSLGSPTTKERPCSFK
jgi:hypothetical protein